MDTCPSLGQTRASAVWPTSNTGCSSASLPRPAPAGVASGGSSHADGCAVPGTPHSAPGANLAKTSLPAVGTEDDRLCPGPRQGFDKSYAPRHAMLYYIL